MAKYDDVPVGGVPGSVMEPPTTVTPTLTPAQKEALWRHDNRAAYEKARNAVCNCAPSRAEMMLVNRYEGHSDY